MKEIQKDFYGHLTAEFIDDNYDHISGRWQHNAESSDWSYDSSLIDTCTGESRLELMRHLSPTKEGINWAWKLQIPFKVDAQSVEQKHCIKAQSE